MKINGTISTVAGRGKILIIEYEEGDRIFDIGDRIYADGDFHKITGIEMKRNLMDPPKISKHVGPVIVNYN